jgi:hypothetical protein
MPFINILNKRFSSLVVVEFIETKNEKSYWKCRCDCGKEIIARGCSLRNNTTKNCGCRRSLEMKNKIFDPADTRKPRPLGRG